jgi:hypothetical protein
LLLDSIIQVFDKREREKERIRERKGERKKDKMYAKKNQGHGICGSKNVYSSSVRIDNWVEDNIGMQLAANPREPETFYKTNTMMSYVSPSEMPELPPMPSNMPSTLELKTKNKDGMPYSLLFEHGRNNVGSAIANDRFKTTTMLALMTRPDMTPSTQESRILLKQKSKDMLRDFQQTKHMSTESRHASSHLLLNHYPEENLKLQATELPNFRRYGALTNTIPKSF